MAIAGTSVWEMRATGANTNGGFYKSDAGTTDYSQQDAAQWTGTNISSDGAGTAITDADTQGLFTAQMVGNGLYITGGDGFTTGWYEIVTFSDSDNVVIERSAGASKTGGTGNVGGAVALPTDALFETSEPGNIWWIEAGTYTFTEGMIMTKDGTIAAPIQIFGYNATRGDAPTGTDRPLFAMGAFTVKFDDYWGFSHVRCTSTATATLVNMDTGGIVLNVKAEYTGSGALASAIIESTSWQVIGCEVTAPNATGNVIGIWSDRTMYNYVHDLGSGATVGIRGDTGSLMAFNVADTCATGMYGLSTDCIMLNNTIYNCTSGITATGGSIKIYNNDINSCTTGITGDSDIEQLDYNNYDSNTADVLNVTKGANATANAPAYTDAANGDFSNTLSASDAMGGALSNNVRQGAIQQSGGGGETAYSSIG